MTQVIHLSFVVCKYFSSLKVADKICGGSIPTSYDTIQNDAQADLFVESLIVRMKTQKN